MENFKNIEDERFYGILLLLLSRFRVIKNNVWQKDKYFWLMTTGH